MPKNKNINKYTVELQNLRRSLASAQKVYNNRSSSKNYDFLVEIGSCAMANKDLLMTLDEQLSSADLLRKIKYLESKLFTDNDYVLQNFFKIQTIVIRRAMMVCSERINAEIDNLVKTDRNQRWYNFFYKTRSSIATAYKFIFSNWKINIGFLAVTGYIGFIPTVTIATIFPSVIVTLKSAIESIFEKFPRLVHNRAFLKRNDLSSSYKMFLYEQNQYWGYDIEDKSFVDPRSPLKNYSFYNQIYDLISNKMNYSISKVEKKLDQIADEKIFNDIREKQILFDNVLIAAGKTLAGLICFTCSILLTVLMAVGLTGPLLLFVMSPALSVGLIGAAVISGLKYMYPDPSKTTMGFVVEKTVDFIFAPVILIYLIAEKITSFFIGLYTYNTEKRIKNAFRKELVNGLNLPDNDKLSVDFATLHQAAPELLPSLIRYFKSKELAIKVKLDIALNNKSDLKQIEEIYNDFASLKVLWGELADKRNELSIFAKSLNEFLQKDYTVERKLVETAAIEQTAKIKKLYTESKQEYLSFSILPNCSMLESMVEHKYIQPLHDLRCLKKLNDQLM